MRVFSCSYTRFLHVILPAIVLATLGSFTAVAQETDAPRELERIDIEAPERRPTPARATRPTAGTESDQAPPEDRSSRPDSESASEVPNAISPATMSLVEGKSGVSIGAASLPAQVEVVTPKIFNSSTSGMTMQTCSAGSRESRQSTTAKAKSAPLSP